MTTMVAAAPATTVSLTPALDPTLSPRQLSQFAQKPSQHAAVSAPPKPTTREDTREGNTNTPRSNGSDSPEMSQKAGSDGNPSPNSSLRPSARPMIKVKKEPTSPPPSSRPRPRRLDLTASMSTSRGPQTGSNGRPSAPLTSKESAGLAIKDMGIACLSPGFQTQDPSMREQLQRSLDVRDQQRQIIEARQKGSSGRPTLTHNASEPGLPNGAMAESNGFFAEGPARTPTTSKRKGPPPGLSISAPSASSFAHERVIQSAPLHQSFTGLHPASRNIHYQPSTLSQTSHIHHVPATQTSNRLPPIADVFAAETLAAGGPASASLRPTFATNAASNSTHQTPSQQSPSHRQDHRPLHSPGFPPQSHSSASQPRSTEHQQGYEYQQPQGFGDRRREFRSAEEAVQNLAQGNAERLPKIVHYGGGLQPPTPPSPLPPGHPMAAHMHSQHAGYPEHTTGQTTGRLSAHNPPHHDAQRMPSSGAGRRRGRDEYERDNGSPSDDHGRYGREGENGRSGGGDDREHKRVPPTSSSMFPGAGSLFMGAVGAGMSALAEGNEEGVERWRERVRGKGMDKEKKEEFLRLCEMAWDLFHG